MWARARSESGFTMIELMLAVLVGTAGLVALVGTFDVSRRVTDYAEMKEAAAHVAEQTIEQLRDVEYGALALSGNPTPASATDPNDPAYYLGTGAAGALTYRWDYGSTATEPLVIAASGVVAAAAQDWDNGRIRGKIYRYVTCVAPTVEECAQGPETSAYKRLTVAVTIDNAMGPDKPILMSTLVGNPETSDGEGANPLNSPNTQCEKNGVTVECAQGVSGTVRTWYLYDTPATQSARQEIAGSHPTHPTVAPTGGCGDNDDDGASDGGSGTDADADGVIDSCPVPDLMALDPPPAPAVTPPVYNYSNEITGGSTPGGAVIRRDAECGGAVTKSDNTKGHLWVSAPLAAPVTLSGDAAMNVSTQTFNGVQAAAMICVRFYNVPGSLSNLVESPPAAIGSGGYSLTSWPRTPTTLGFAMDFLDGAGVQIPAGNRLGVRVWAAASSAADIVVLYDHPLYPTFVQVNEAQ